MKEKVVRLMEFGAFVTILPGKDGFGSYFTNIRRES